MRVLLMGNPNVGKSAVFSRLTGTHVLASNYPGTTVEYVRGSMKLADQTVEVVDVPGSYSMEPSNRAEEVAVRMLAGGDVIINVIDAANLERNLYLSLQLLQSGKPVILALNMWDEALEQGIATDTAALEKLLGVPVVTTCALTGDGLTLLKNRIAEARPGHLAIPPGQDLWQTISTVVGKTQKKPENGPGFRQRLADLTIQPIAGPVIALLVLLLSFAFVALLGDWLHEEVMAELFEWLWMPVVLRISGALGQSGFIHDLLIGGLVDGTIDFEQSFGLITTGLYIPLAVVMPFIFCFYLALSLLEDIGYLPRLGVLVDTMMHRMGLHGLSIVPMMLGIGCNVPGAMAGRVLETRKQRLITATLLAIAVPCMAQQAMVVGLLGRAGIAGLAIVYGTLFILWVLLGMILNFFFRGDTPEMLIEIPPYRRPYWKSLSKKVYMRMSGFTRSALPYVLLGVFLVNMLYSLGIIAIMSRFFEPVISGLFGLPGEAVGALVIGFLRKDVAVGMLAPLGLDPVQLIVASVVLVIYFPCAATFVVMFKELGLRDMFTALMIMIVVVVVVGGGLNVLLRTTGLF